MSSFLAVLTFVVFFLGMPVSLGIGTIALFYLVAGGEFSLVTIPQKIFTGMDSFLLLAIPFFILAGALMNHGGITRRLVDFSTTLVGHIAGGLGHVTVVANVIMSGMSGTAAADAVATGTVLIPSMIRQGYSRGFAAAISACAATIGPIIPPSRRVRDLRQPDFGLDRPALPCGRHSRTADGRLPDGRLLHRGAPARLRRCCTSARASSEVGAPSCTRFRPC